MLRPVGHAGARQTDRSDDTARVAPQPPERHPSVNECDYLSLQTWRRRTRRQLLAGSAQSLVVNPNARTRMPPQRATRAQRRPTRRAARCGDCAPTAMQRAPEGAGRRTTCGAQGALAPRLAGQPDVTQESGPTPRRRRRRSARQVGSSRPRCVDMHPHSTDVRDNERSRPHCGRERSRLRLRGTRSTHHMPVNSKSGVNVSRETVGGSAPRCCAGTPSCRMRWRLATSPELSGRIDRTGLDKSGRRPALQLRTSHRSPMVGPAPYKSVAD